MGSHGHPKVLWKYRRLHNQLIMWLSNFQKVVPDAISYWNKETYWTSVSLFLWPITNTSQHPHLRHTHGYIFHLQETLWYEPREHIWAMKLENKAHIWESMKRHLLCSFFFFFLKPPFKNWLAGDYLHFITNPFPLKSRRISLVYEARTGFGWGDSVIHLVSFPLLGEGLLFYSSWFKIENLGAFNNKQQQQ